MTARSLIAQLVEQENLNFLLTNRIPRRLATSFMGWFSRIEHPLVRDLSIALWRLFSDLDLSEARKTQFTSVHDCFTRELREGVRPIDPDPAVLASPCDAIIGACGTIAGDELLQVKGRSYTLRELFGQCDLVSIYRGGQYATLRLTSGMYHRFHAPHDCRVESVTHIPGDTFNVNPVALKRVDRLFCKNERAVLRTRLTASGHPVTLVPVAAILVAGIRLRFLDPERMPYRLRDQCRRDLSANARGFGNETVTASPDEASMSGRSRRGGPAVIACDASLEKGEEMGWFEHGSTIIVFAPEGFSLCSSVREGAVIRMGQPLMRLP